MKKYLILFTGFLLFWSSACEPLTPIPPNLSATIVEIEGEQVNVLHAHATEYQPAKLDEQISVKSVVNTGIESRARVDLSSGTVIRISPESVFTLENNYEGQEGLFTRLQISVGRIWIVLNGGTLEVETPSGLAGVRGSYMSTGYDPASGAVRITCLEGHCSAENDAGAVQFAAGEAADLSADGAAPVKGLMTDEEFATWAENVPEASEILAEIAEPAATPSVLAPTPTPLPELGACVVTSTYLYVRACPEATCEPLGYVESGDTLQLLEETHDDGWLAVVFEDQTGWINGTFCEE